MQGNKQAIQKEIEEAKNKNLSNSPTTEPAVTPQAHNALQQPFVTGGEVTTPHNAGLQITNRYFANPNAGDLGAYKGEDLIKKEPDMVSFSFPVQSDTTNEAHEGAAAPINQPATAEPTKPVKKAGSYIPAGSFVRAILIGGLDAPTGGQAQSNPHPVLMKLDDLAQLPNDLKYDVKNCHLIGASYGDISSERAIIRLETLSCIDQNDVVHEANVKGFVFGEDGKAGVRGRVITKQGQLLVNSLIAGIGAGIGQAFQQQSMTYSTSALGSVSTIDPEKIGVSGVGTGVGKALDRLSQYYISLAEKMFPVIEVDAGRSVDVVLTSGFSFDSTPAQKVGDMSYLAGIDSLTDKGKNVIKQVQGMTGAN
jgi:conjugal transfer pilus assembly protein TraB